MTTLQDYIKSRDVSTPQNNGINFFQNHYKEKNASFGQARSGLGWLNKQKMSAIAKKQNSQPVSPISESHEELQKMDPETTLEFVKSIDAPTFAPGNDLL